MVTVESQIEQVVVYANGARVRRIAILKAPIPAMVRLAGLPVSVIDDTVRTELEGPAVVTAIRTADEVQGDAVADEETPELRAARRRVAIAEAEVERIGGTLEQVTRAAVVADDPTEEPPAVWAQVVAARRTLVTVRAERERGLRDQHAAARRELDEARRAFDVVAERDRRSGSARAAKLHEPRKHVELELAAKGAGDVTLRFEYQVAAARWAPSYVARLDGTQVTFELRAVVAQDTGEDWKGVALRLSTAEPARFAELPELAAQKIGRRQAEVAKRGFRPPPVGADELYRDYDRDFPRVVVTTSFAKTKFDDSTYEGRAPTAPPAPPPMLMGQDLGVPNDQSWDEESSNAMPEAPLAMMPMASRSKAGGIASAIGGVLAAPLGLAAAAAQSIARGASAPGGGGPAAPKKRQATNVESAPPIPRLDYAALVMQPPSAADRGKLVAVEPHVDDDTRTRVFAGVAAIEQLALPPGHDADWDHVYDYAFASDGAVDVKSDAAWHGIALTSKTGAAKLHHVAVPREQSDVFRVASIANPLDGPLLPGPIDVYDRGQFLVTSEIDYTPPGGTVEVGLGVDAQVKIARNVEYHEEATGMLRGGLKLVHAITIDVENLAPRAIDLEIRERVPVTREGDDDVEVLIGKTDPPWEPWTPDATGPREARLRGGHRWKLAIAPNGKKLVRASYEIKIAGKHELVGGNRRES